MTQHIAFGTPFQAQVDFLLKKVSLPTERWDDIQRAAHDKAFIVAGAAKADLLFDLHKAVVAAASEGTGLEAFRKSFKGIVAKHGWTGWTGEGTKAGEAWRTRVIYQTNMATSYAAGRYRQLMDPVMLKERPAWRYIHSDSVMHPRPQHLAWHGLTLPAEHKFWKTHFAPNGWGCHCRITAVTWDEYLRSKAAGLSEPPDGWDKLDARTGEPVGIDKGFGYTPGAATDATLRSLVQDKLVTYPEAITKALTRDVGKFINATASPTRWVQKLLDDRTVVDTLWLGFVENVAEVAAAAGQDVAGYLVLLPSEAVHHQVKSHGHDGGDQRPARPEDYAHLAEVLASPDSLVAGGESKSRKLPTVVATKKVGNDTYRATFEVGGKKSRALSLVSLVVKTK